ncbi:hypothetical protein [Halomonas sp. HAL1]|uniref:hypothetical protein n=1 Tax=Halomonas sp. HAL1 TaxID=550984 RepID=UPI001EE6710B|nr:hypothetical protein [Halomonas sp. HAL1]WKV95055.1 hypothetical protein Q3Y66_08900 [Halomonas sp. HAL1]
MPNPGFKTDIQKASDRQIILMRLYQAPEHIKGLGDASYHNKQLACLQARLRLSTTTISLPDILSAKVDALNNDYFHSNRTDVGLYLEQTDNAQDIALPLPYRRVDIPTHYYSSTRFGDLADLHDALAHTITHLLYSQDSFHVSGQPPQVLWKAHYLELRLPLIGQQEG